MLPAIHLVSSLSRPQTFPALCKPAIASLASLSLVLAAVFYPMGSARASQAKHTEIGSIQIGATASSILMTAKPLETPDSESSRTSFGDRILINGQTFNVPWVQWHTGDTTHIGLSDVAMMQDLGIELADTPDPNRQPIRWFSPTPNSPLVLSAQLIQQRRYLDITPLINQQNWKFQIQDQVLRLQTPPIQVLAIKELGQSGQDTVVITLDGPTPIHTRQQADQLTISLSATLSPQLQAQLLANPAKIARDALRHRASPKLLPQTQPGLLTFQVQASPETQILTRAQPNQIIIGDRRSLPPLDRDIQWAPGLRWQQQVIPVGTSQFPVVWLTLDPREPNLSMRPIWVNPDSMVGTEPLLEMAQRWRTVAAINAGFFSRQTLTPLGAIRHNQTWLSSPILGRGVLAWNGINDVQFDRLAVQETLKTSSGQQFPLQSFNSGYPQAGLAYYNRSWGSRYQALTDNEIVLTVINDRITNSQNLSTSEPPIPIPANGYLITARSYQSVITDLVPGTFIEIQRQTIPDQLAPFSQIVGAGPLLIRDQTIWLNPGLEKFSPAFAQQKAYRSAIGQTAEGNLILVAVSSRLGGPGPSLSELVVIMQQLGAIHALNLDGGSSTSLYLGGRLINRSLRHVARVHNGLGIFITQSTQPN